MEIRNPDEGSLQAVLSLLQENGLHIDDNACWDLNTFYVVLVNNHIAGCMGLELKGEVALLRSVATDTLFRGQGIAKKLHTYVKEQARARGVNRLYLFTVTAGEYFERHGYQAVDRDKVPQEIKDTWEYSQACPRDALVMMLDLNSPREQAAVQFEQGWYCAESVLKAVAKQYNIQSELIPGIASGMCSGIARSGGMCGAVAGGILALSMIYGRRSPDDSINPLYEKVNQLQQRFENKNKSCDCTTLLGKALGTPEGQQHFQHNILQLDCREYAGDAVEIIQELIQEGA